jgi:hypothetical protein
VATGPEKLELASQRAVDHGADTMLAALELQLGPDGNAYGQLPVRNGGDFIDFYNDLRERDFEVPGPPQVDENGEEVLDEEGNPILLPGPTVKISVLRMLRGVNPKLAEQLDRQFRKEMERVQERVS